jgi:alkylation response protein AidB-like acyl-CoA dehydrogenase
VDPNEYRRQDYDLSVDEESVRSAFAEFFRSESTSTVVRNAQPVGFDAGLWDKVVRVGITGMAAPVHVGGDGAGMVEMSLVAEEVGHRLAPVPIIDHVVATRLLAAAGDHQHDEVVHEAVAGKRILGLALQPLTARRIVGSAAVARDVVGLDDEGVALFSAADGRPHIPNQASLPYAWVDRAQDRVVRVAAQDPRGHFDRALREWKVLTASALVGLAAGSLEPAIEFAKTRQTLGVAIGTLQGVQFPLVDTHMAVLGGRNLARRAAWFLDNEPDAEQQLAAEAYTHAARTATRGATAAAHAQGGLGFIDESDASLFFLRAKGWALGVGDLAYEFRSVGEAALDNRRLLRA